MSRPYVIELAPGAAKALRKLRSGTPGEAQRVLDALQELAADPRPGGKKVKALVGQRGYLRLRVGDYRVVYTVLDERLVVLVVAIGHRRQVYES